MIKNLTSGNPLKLIIDFSMPLLLGNILQQTYNIADASLVGKILGSEALAGVGASSSVQFLILGFCMGLCTGFAIPVAQRFGADDFKDMKNYIFNSVILTFAFSIIITVCCLILCKKILILLSTPEDIFDFAYSYLFIIFAGIPFSMFYNLLAGFLRSVGDSKTPFIVLLISTITNIALDLLFIITFNGGVAGAALATIISQFLSALLCFFFIIKKFDVLKLKKENCKIILKKIAVLLSSGLPMGFQFSITAIGSMVIQAANNRLGSLYVTAFTASAKIKQFSMCPFDAIATAVATFASQNYGAGKVDRIKKGLWQGVLLGVSYGIFIGLVIYFFGEKISLLFIDKNEVDIIKACGQYVKTLALFFWLIGILNSLRMTTQGLGFSPRAIFSGVVEMIARCFVGFVLVPKYEYTAICFADPSAWLAAVLYITPTCLLCIRKVRIKIENPQGRNRKKVSLKQKKIDSKTL